MKINFCLHFFIALFIASANDTFAQSMQGDKFYVNRNVDSISFINQHQNSGKDSQEVIEKNIINYAAIKRGAASIITIPVVVHVLWNQAVDDISKEQIESQIDVLNKDFQLANDDAVECPERFKKIQANCQIAFRLASRDPKGNPTNGIERRKTQISSFSKGDDNLKYFSKGGLDAWDRDQYLNVWIVPNIADAYGYAQWPWLIKSAKTDGIVIEQTQFGVTSNIKPVTTTAMRLGRTATHEVGHWLNLKHIWNFSCLYSDEVDDTPSQFKSHRDECPDVNNPPITCLNGPNGDMFMNFMDETEDKCMNMFTEGQKKRMHKLFEPGALRYPLLSSKGFLEPLTPDLIIQNPQVPATPLARGGSVTISCKNKNQGTATAGSSITSVWLSQDKIFHGTPKDINLYLDLNVPDLNPGLISNTLSGQITIPTSISPGTWYIIFGADALNQINERNNEFNNQAFLTILIRDNIAEQTNENNIQASKDPNCKEKNTGDYCFQNNTNLGLRVTLNSSPGKGASYGSSFTCTLQPGQRQCFFNVPAGAANYRIITSSNSNSSQYYDADGSLYVDPCQENTFLINSETPSYATNIPTKTNETKNQISKEVDCNTNNTGDYCFQNNTNLGLRVTLNSSPGKGASYGSSFTCTLQPGQRQCFFNVPAGAANYRIITSSNSNSSQYYDADGSLYVDPCQENTFLINSETPSYATNIPTKTNETKNQISKEVDCNTNNTGDYCFQNNTKLGLRVTLNSSPGKGASYGSSFTCTLQPGQRQCFFNVPAGAASYRIITSSNSNSSQYYDADGSLYVDLCKENTFLINSETPSYATNIPTKTNETKNQISKEVDCNTNNTGDYCFQNNTKLGLRVTLNSSPGKGASYGSSFTCTLQPGQRQCFFNVPAGAASYRIITSSNSNSSQYYDADGSLYVGPCKENTFIIK